jgi:hypothetical protein
MLYTERMQHNYSGIPFRLGQYTTTATPDEQILNAMYNTVLVSNKLRTANKIEEINAVIGDLQKAKALMVNTINKFKPVR